jgi:hypothetical protein
VAAQANTVFFASIGLDVVLCRDIFASHSASFAYIELVGQLPVVCELIPDWV